jgi:hypothetical protein
MFLSLVHRGLYPFGEYISYTNQSFTIHEIKHLWRKHHCAKMYGRDLNIRVDIFENPAETNVLCSDWNSWKDPIIWLVLQFHPRINYMLCNIPFGMSWICFCCNGVQKNGNGDNFSKVLIDCGGTLDGRDICFCILHLRRK